jgi:hypothetical protein
VLNTETSRANFRRCGVTCTAGRNHLRGGAAAPANVTCGTGVCCPGGASLHRSDRERELLGVTGRFAVQAERGRRWGGGVGETDAWFGRLPESSRKQSRPAGAPWSQPSVRFPSPCWQYILPTWGLQGDGRKRDKGAVPLSRHRYPLPRQSGSIEEGRMLPPAPAFFNTLGRFQDRSSAREGQVCGTSRSPHLFGVESRPGRPLDKER